MIYKGFIAVQIEFWSDPTSLRMRQAFAAASAAAFNPDMQKVLTAAMGALSLGFPPVPAALVVGTSILLGGTFRWHRG
eukprot:3067388-Prymnesium_polylepis.1